VTAEQLSLSLSLSLSRYRNVDVQRVLVQDYEERIASLQEQVERNSMMSSTIRFDVEDDDECNL